MDNSSIIIAILVIAVMALIGRIIINRQQKKNISWAKIGSVGLIVVVFILVFLFFDAHRFMQWYEGEATMLDARTQCISGRKAANDIPRFSSLSDTLPSNYYAIEAIALEATGYYKLKNNLEIDQTLDRSVAETENNSLAIKRKTSLFGITRTPSDNIDKYLPIYFVTLKNGGKVVACMEPQDANVGVLRIGMMRPMEERMFNAMQKVDSLDIVEKGYYFNLFNDQRYIANQNNYLIYRMIAALLVAIIFGIIYIFVFRRNTKIGNR